MALLMQCKNGLCIRVQGIKGGKKEVPQESDMTTERPGGERVMVTSPRAQKKMTARTCRAIEDPLTSEHIL